MRILIADDHAVVRRGLRQILADAFPKAVFGEAGNAPEALEQVWKQKWELVMLDVTMPGRSGLEVLKEIKSARPKLPVLILSVQPESQYGVRVLKAGAAGFLNKDSAPETLVFAVKKILEGGRYVSPALAEKLAADVASNGSQLPHESLSDREMEVLCLIASGKTPTEIAEQLSLSVKTVSTYRSRILEKMNMETTAELMHYALANRLVEPSSR